MSLLLDAGLYHHALGRRMIAVNAEKKPYRKGWNEYFAREQSEIEIREEFSNGAHGIAMVLWPACPFAVLDFDGQHAEQAWSATGIELPDTARNFTRSGGKHLYFLMPADTATDLKRNVRLAKIDCDCLEPGGKPHPCGVDLLIRGYAILPPTPGYTEDPDHPLEDAVLLPAAVVLLAIDKRKEKAKPEGRRHWQRGRPG